MNKTVFLFCAFVFISFLSMAQSIERDVVASSGDYYNGSGGGLSWTLGDVAVENYEVGRNEDLSQGFQQKNMNRGFIYSFLSGFFEETAETEIELFSTDIIIEDELNSEELSLSVFPNPAANSINIALIGPWEGDVFVKITDMLGRVVLTEKLNDVQFTQLNISSLDNGIYILQIESKKLNSRSSIKINKIN